MSGGEGEDEFVFMSPRGAASERDRILYFAKDEDRIDISAIDANVFRDGDQAFRFDGSSGTGRAWVEEDPDPNGSLLYADTGRGVLVVAIREAGDMDASDYEAIDFLVRSPRRAPPAPPRISVECPRRPVVRFRAPPRPTPGFSRARLSLGD